MDQKITQEQKIQVVKRIFSEDIEEYSKFFFPNHITKAIPSFHGEIYKLYCGISRRIAVVAPRGHAKSTITDLIYLSWVIVHNKVKFVLLISDTYTQAALFLETLKAEFEGNERLQQFYGNQVSAKWAEGEIVVNGIMIKALGAGMKVRGLKYRESRPDLIICDDLENDELVESLERREKLERWFNGAVVPSLDETGRIIVIGTILHYDSLLAKMLRLDNYGEYEKKIYRVLTKDLPLWAEHMNKDAIDTKKQEYISKGLGFQFFREYMNDPVSDENQKFKPEKMKFYKEQTLDGKILNTFLSLDRAYSIELTADFTGITVVSVDIHNNWYIRLAERFQGNEKQLIDRIFDLVGFYAPTLTGIEQKAFEYTLKIALQDEMRRRNQFFKVQELKDLGRNKNLRIEGLVPRYESGSIYFQENQVHLREEMERFPRGEHDDLLDSLAYQLVLANSPSHKIIQREDIKELETLDWKEW